MAHQAGIYFRFRLHEAIRSISIPPLDRIVANCKVTSSLHPALIRRYTFKHLGSISRRPRKRFGPTKPFPVNPYLKTARCVIVYTPETSCMKRTSVHIKNMCINSSVVIRFEILLQLFGCKHFLGPLRNGPQS